MNIEKEINDLKINFKSLYDKIDSIVLKHIEPVIAELSKKQELNAKRIETLKGSNIQDQINDTNKRISMLDSKIKKLLLQLADLEKQREEIIALGKKAAKNVSHVTEDLIELKDNDIKISLRIDELLKTYEKLKTLKEKAELIEDVKAIKIKIEKLSSQIDKNNKTIELNNTQINANASNIKTLTLRK